MNNRKAPTKPGVVSARVDNYWRVTLDDGDIEHVSTAELNYDNVEVGDRVVITYCENGMLTGAFSAPKAARQS